MMREGEPHMHGLVPVPACDYVRVRLPRRFFSSPVRRESLVLQVESITRRMQTKTMDGP